jgi:hypothetical protein
VLFNPVGVLVQTAMSPSSRTKAVTELEEVWLINTLQYHTCRFPSWVRLNVRRSSDCPVFSLVSSLSSAESAGDGTSPLFAGFSGTMELSDSSATCMSGLWHRAFADRSVSMGETDAAEVSRLPRGRFPTVLVVSDSVGFTADLPLAFVMNVAFPLSGQGRPPQRDVFGAQYTARLCFCERFDGQVAQPIASLEAKATG